MLGGVILFMLFVHVVERSVVSVGLFATLKESLECLIAATLGS